MGVPMTVRRGLGSSFVRLRRDIVTSGRWARLWRHDQGLGASTAPVMALLRPRTVEGAAEADLNWLAAHTGVSKVGMQRARLSLLQSGFVKFMPGPRRGTWRFRVADSLIAKRKAPSFYFLGSLVSGGLWAGLPAEARNLLVVLSASVKAQVRSTDSGDFGEQLPEPVVDELYEDELLDEDESLLPIGTVVARRIGRITGPELLALSGLSTEFIAPILRGLAGEGKLTDPLVRILAVIEEDIWYHLPAFWWEPPWLGGYARGE